MIKQLRTPLLLIAAVLIALAMLRLGVWQLDRAAVKQQVLDQQTQKAQRAPVGLAELNFDAIDELRFVQVETQGQWLAEHTVLVDNQVFDSRVGYRVFTPMQWGADQPVIMVDRGWIPVGENRQTLPQVATAAAVLSLRGRLNVAPAQPPLWNDAYPVSSGQVWQYLPLDEYAVQSGLSVLPLVLELAPDWSGEPDTRLQRRWQAIDDKWVGKHKAYAFQWFAMALVFMLACGVVAVRQKRGQLQ